MPRRVPVKKKQSVISAGGLLGAFCFVALLIVIRLGFVALRHHAKDRASETPGVVTVTGPDGSTIKMERSGADSKWMDIVSRDGGYFIIAPSQGNEASERRRGVPGSTHRRNWMWSDLAALEVRYTDLDANGPEVTEPGAFLDRLALLTKQSMQNAQVDFIDIEGFPGIDVTAKNRDGTSTWQRTYLVGTRRYELTVSCKTNVLLDKRIQQFMGSFELDMDSGVIQRLTRKNQLEMIRPKRK